MIYLCIVGKDQESVDRFFRDSPAVARKSGDEIVGIANGSPGLGLGYIGNAHLGEAAKRGADVFGLCHADCTFGPGALDVFEATTREGKLAGIVGRDILGAYHWSNGSANGPGEVSTLDGSCIFMPTRIALRFDVAHFNSHHCVVEDFCLQAQALEIPSVVPAANASHRGESTQHTGWQRDYWHYREILSLKWIGHNFQTT